MSRIVVFFALLVVAGLAAGGVYREWGPRPSAVRTPEPPSGEEVRRAVGKEPASPDSDPHPPVPASSPVATTLPVVDPYRSTFNSIFDRWVDKQPVAKE